MGNGLKTFYKASGITLGATLFAYYASRHHFPEVWERWEQKLDRELEENGCSKKYMGSNKELGTGMKCLRLIATKILYPK
jgi:hypothetical protein